MRFLIFSFLLGSLVCGCTHAPQPPARMNVDGATISISKEEIDAIVQEAVRKYKLVFRWYVIKDENTVELYMSDKPQRPHGAVVVYKKIGGKWQEVSFTGDGWIV